MYYLHNDSVTMEELDETERLLSQYVRQFEEYFGETNMSLNVHLMTHLTATVRNWGPTWATDAYKYESWNKRIVDKVTSPNCRAEQIANRFLMAKFIDSIVWDDEIAEETKSLIAEIRKVHRSYGGEIHNDFTGLGKMVNRLPTDIEKAALRMRLGYEPEHVTCYKKAKIYGNEYRSKNDKTNIYCNSLIFSKDNGYGEIMTIVEFKHGEDRIYGMFIKKLRVIKSAFKTQYMKKVNITNEIYIMEISQTMKLAVQISIQNGCYCYALPNCWTSD